MVDGPAGGGSMGTGDRLDHLRAYNTRLHKGEYLCVEDYFPDASAGPEAPWELAWSTGASVAYATSKAGRRELVLAVPPVGYGEGIRKRPKVIVPVDDFGPGALLATDYTQDLLVGVKKHIDDCR